jgi:iron complex outermembrane receptor protein
MTRFHVNRLMIGTCVAALTASPAFAAQAAPLAQSTPERTTSTQAPPSSNANQDIIVTAQKRAQLLIDVPQSISVISGGTLEKQQANSFQDYLKLVPGLQLTQSTPGATRLIIRGINAAGAGSAVGVYMDETPFGSSTGLANGAILAGDFDTFDLDRIEVLRGPQGTFYGASSLSGVLKFVTKLPSTTAFLVRGRAGIESVKGGDLGYQSNLVVNVPLSSTLAFRASGSYRKDGGFVNSIGTAGSDVERRINGTKSYSGRASLLFKPSSEVSVRLTALAQDIKAKASSDVEVDSVTLEPSYGQLSQSQFAPQFTNVKYRVYNATMTFGLGFADLTSSSSYSTQKQTSLVDLTFLYSPIVQAYFYHFPNEFVDPKNVNVRKYTQEVRLSSHSSRLDWLVGGFFADEKAMFHQGFFANIPGTNTAYAGQPNLGQVDLNSKYKELAGFADATVHVTDAFDLDFGGRYSHNKQENHQVLDGLLLGGFNDLGIAHSRENVFTYSVAPKLKLSRNATLYARVAKGFRPGGPNALAPGAPASLATYKSDSIINYEVGFKGQTDDRRFSFDAAVFHIDWSNIQLIRTINNFSANSNGSAAKSDGVEFTATARPVPGLDISLNGAYTHARLTADTEVGGLKGDELPYSPKFSLGLNADYHWSLAQGVAGHVGGSLRHLSHQSADFNAGYRTANGHQRQVPGYEVVDLGAGVDFGKFSVDVYAKNVGNRRGITSLNASPFVPGGVSASIIRPRTVGLSVTAAY